MSALKEKIDVDADKVMEGDYKGYSWNILSKEENGEGKKSLMREYNNCIYCIDNCKREIKIINTIYSNVKEDKTYKLNIRVASELGF
jgi:hypothetical protein